LAEENGAHVKKRERTATGSVSVIAPKNAGNHDNTHSSALSLSSFGDFILLSFASDTTTATVSSV
jgi:hypothetical protein